MNHSPLPWIYGDDWFLSPLDGGDQSDWMGIYGEDGEAIIWPAREIRGDKESLDNMKFICLAVNHHEELMKMLYLMMGQLCFCIAKHYAVERLDAEELADVIASYEKGKAFLAKLEAEK